MRQMSGSRVPNVCCVGREEGEGRTENRIQGGQEEPFSPSKALHLLCTLIRAQESHVTLRFEKLYSKRGHGGGPVDSHLDALWPVGRAKKFKGRTSPFWVLIVCPHESIQMVTNTQLLFLLC